MLKQTKQELVDLKWMREALALAKKGRGTTAPNPCVGAVVVKHNRKISSGYHRTCGQAHAEVIALKKAGRRAQGATLYVTLEPCSHVGRTPPCVEAVAQYGIKRVVIAAWDPHPRAPRRGARYLRARGIQVTTGVLREPAEQLNQPFRKWSRDQMPYVTVKVAQSVDGKIATYSGHSKWISNAKSRELVQSLRKASDAILVGIGTVRADDPRLTVRKAIIKHPLKVVLDPSLSISPKARIFNPPGRTLIVTTKTKRASLKRLVYNAEIVALPSQRGLISLRALLRFLATRGVMHLLVEGGGETIARFMEAKLVDDAYVFIAPKIIGGRQARTAVEGHGVASVDRALKFKDFTTRKVGSDLLLYGELA